MVDCLQVSRRNCHGPKRPRDTVTVADRTDTSGTPCRFVTVRDSCGEPELQTKKTGRPKTDEGEDRKRIEHALARDPSIKSARRLLEVCKELGIGGNEKRMGAAWKAYAAAETVSAAQGQAAP